MLKDQYISPIYLSLSPCDAKHFPLPDNICLSQWKAEKTEAAQEQQIQILGEKINYQILFDKKSIFDTTSLQRNDTDKHKMYILYFSCDITEISTGTAMAGIFGYFVVYVFPWLVRVNVIGTTPTVQVLSKKFLPHPSMRFHRLKLSNILPKLNISI